MYKCKWTETSGCLKGRNMFWNTYGLLYKMLNKTVAGILDSLQFPYVVCESWFNKNPSTLQKFPSTSSPFLPKRTYIWNKMTYTLAWRWLFVSSNFYLLLLLLLSQFISSVHFVTMCLLNYCVHFSFSVILNVLLIIIYHHIWCWHHGIAPGREV